MIFFKKIYIFCIKKIYNLFDDVLNLKIKITNFIKNYYKHPDFKINKVLLYKNLTEECSVTDYFKYNNIKYIDNKLIENILYENMILYYLNENIRLKIFFSYKNIEYIIYFPYKKNESKKFIPYFPYSEDIIKNYRNDIISPIYIKNNNKKYFYSLFGMDSKDISYVSINNIKNNNLLKYFQMIQTPFNDFGILYDLPVKLEWVLSENNINIEEFNELKIIFTNYFDEDTFEMKEHTIILNNNDLNNNIISERMKEIMAIKNLKDKE